MAPDTNSLTPHPRLTSPPPSEKPVVRSPLPLETYGDLGKTLTLSCDVAAQPPPYVQWYRDARAVAALQDLRWVLMVI